MASRAFLLVTVTLAAATALDAQRRRPRGKVPELANCTFATAELESEALGRPASYGIFLPKGYGEEENAGERYPLIVWLHGMFEDHERFARRGGARVLDEMLGDGELPETIFVTPNGGRTKFYVNGLESGRYEDLIVEDLLSHLEETYRIANDRGLRALMGVSMGGYGALKIALRYPDAFGVVAVHSAAIFPPDPDNLPPRFQRALQTWGQRLGLPEVFGNPLDKELWQENNPLFLAKRIDPDRLQGLRMYFDCGSRDRYGFHEPNRQLHRVLEDREIPHVWRLVEDGGHGWRSGYNTERLPHSLRFVARRFAAARARAGLGGALAPGNGDKARGGASGRGKSR